MPLPSIRNDHRGFALISVVLLLALLTILASSAALLSSSHRRSASRLAETIRLDARCDSALRLIVLRLIAPARTTDQIPIGAPVAVALPDGTARVTISREAGKIDLNTASPQLIYALFAANGWKEKDARAMADRIADWRDPDDEVRPEGAEHPQYEAAELRYGPRNEPFRSLSEVRQVLGGERISPELLESFTLYTHLSAPVERIAVAPVGRALSFANAHELDGHRWLLSTELAHPDVSADIRSLSGEVVTLNACAQAGALTRCRTAVIRLTGNARRPPQTLVWQSQFQPASPTVSVAAR